MAAQFMFRRGNWYYTSFEVLLNPALRYDGTDEVTVVVDSTEHADIPPFDGQIDYLTYGGIYREVQLYLVDQVHINNIFAKPQNCLAEKKALSVDVTISNDNGRSGFANISVRLLDGDTVVVQKDEKCQLSSAGADVFTFDFEELENIQLWNLNTPKLYTVEVKTDSDTSSRRTGFRECSYQ